MKKVFLLQKQDIALAKQEVLNIIPNIDYELADTLLILNTKFNDYQRLAYTRRIYDLLFIAYKKNLEEKFKNFDWESIFNKDFSLRIFNSDISEAVTAGFIWDSLKKPKVNLKNPKTEIHLIKKGSKFFCCLLKKELKQDFESRKPHKRPQLMPFSLHPKLARALVNLTGIQKNETLLDPFCGIGGILIEAGLMNMKIIGYDINSSILEKGRANLNHYNLKNFILEKRDALTLEEKFDYIATDLPYGLNTTKTDHKRLYLGFLKVLENNLQKKAVVVFPNFIDHKKLINQTKLHIESEFSYYIHKSLTKKIVVLKP